MYLIVSFPEEESVAVVPSTWVSGDNCYWPNTKNVERLVRLNKAPLETWSLCPAVIKQHCGKAISKVSILAL